MTNDKRLSFKDERKILNDLRPALHRILSIAAALHEIKLERVPDSFESSSRDTTSTYRLSFSDGTSGESSKPESVNSTVSETTSVTELTFEPDMRQEINDFVSKTSDGMLLESSQWEGLAASAQKSLFEIGSGVQLAGADASIMNEVWTILERLSTAFGKRARGIQPSTSRKRVRSRSSSPDTQRTARSFTSTTECQMLQDYLAPP